MVKYVLFGTAIAFATLGGCVASGHATMGVETTGVVYQDPPPPRVETVTARPGFLFIKGRWNWQNGQWVWVDGRWERERAGYAYSDGRWERRGNRWEWIEGTWTAVVQGGVTVSGGEEPRPIPQGGVEVSTEPNVAPPPPRAETQASRAGFVWISGRWDWKAGQWAWVDGHWERERANQVWVQGNWELHGNRWAWVDGHWRNVPAAGPVVRDHR